MKKCTKCKQTKPLSEFSRATANKDGHTYYCKTCISTYMKEYRNREKVKIRGKAYDQSERRRAKRKRYHASEKGKRVRARYHASAHAKKKRRENAAKGRASNPAMYRAHKMVMRAVKAGELPRVTDLTCDNCDRPARHYHHPNGYSERHTLDVIPLCPFCHRATFKYKTHTHEGENDGTIEDIQN